jgi:cation diffusion facilitator CzcD-associated flavoprotein CzcO
VRARVVVVGGGQAGLSAAHHLRRAGLEPGEFVVLDDAPGPGGAWQHRWDSLTIGQTHSIQDLPGMGPPPADPTARASVAMSEYFAEYERAFDLQVYRPVRVVAVREAAPEESGGERLRIETDSGEWLADGVINATGTWQKPFWPVYPGRDTFSGRQLHTRDFRSARAFFGRQVLVVGGGTSAVQLLLQISAVARTTWVTRRPPDFSEAPFDEAARRAAVAVVDARMRAALPPLSVVSATGLPLTPEYRRGIASGVLRALPMFARIVPDGVVWDAADVPPAPEHLRVDAIVWATGFRANLDHLAPLRLRTRGGGIVMDGPEVVADPRIQLIGYGPSASIVGANRAGREAVRNLRRVLGF